MRAIVVRPSGYAAERPRSVRRDDNGNRTSATDQVGKVTLFTYDAACRLVAVADASTETTIATYTYDAFNRRTSSGLGDLNRTYYHYDGASSRVIAEQTFGVPTTTYTYDDAGSLFSMTRAGETYYYHTNARGDVVAMSDSSGAVVNTYAYDPWGTLLSASETVANPYRYASYRYDEATGLYYCWNRYYAPELARFLTRDIYPGELSDPVTMNPYLYCGGDPVDRVDPSGLWTSGQGLVVSAYYPSAGLSGSALWVSDDEGGFGVAISYGWYGSTCWGAGLQRQVQITSASSVCALEGDSWAAGASGGEGVGGGAELMGSRDGSYGGLNVFGGLTMGAPFESHASYERTYVFSTSWSEIGTALMDAAALEGRLLLGGAL